MQTLLKEPVHVSAVFRGFRENGNPAGEAEHKRITPRQIKRKKRGEVLKISQVRRSWAQRKGGNVQVHFNIETEGERFFHLVYESQKMIWILLYEFDDQLLFDQMDIEVQVNKKGGNA